MCKNHTIHRIVFILALNDAEKFLSKNIAVLHVSFTRISPPQSEDTDSGLTRISPYTLIIQAISRTLFNVESLSHILLTHFELLYTYVYEFLSRS